MAQREFGIYDENFNDGFNNGFNEEALGVQGFDDTFRFDEFGNGGGSIIRGGGGTTIINGCTDPKAKNYNRFATRDDGSCVYNPPALSSNLNKEISFNIKAAGKVGKIVVDEVDSTDIKF